MARLDWDNKGGHKTTHAYLEVTPRCVGSQLQWPAQNHSLMCNGLLHVKFSASFQRSHSGQVSGTMDRSIGRCQVLSSTRPYCKKWQWCNSTKAVIKSQLHNGAYKVHAIAPLCTAHSEIQALPSLSHSDLTRPMACFMEVLGFAALPGFVAWISHKQLTRYNV
jgi:hypothetical protein